jgi:hypothetical protein
MFPNPRTQEANPNEKDITVVFLKMFSYLGSSVKTPSFYWDSIRGNS